MARARNSSQATLLLDTHVWVWETAGSRQLSHSARRIINDASQSGRLRLSTISIWEISWLASLGKIELDLPATRWIAEARTKSRVLLEPVTAEIALEAGSLPGGFRSDPADQIIVATARLTGATLLTRDGRILDYGETGLLKTIHV